MTLILKQVFALIKLLNSDTGTNQIAFGVAFGFILGMTPSFSLQTVIVITCLIFLRIQVGMALISAFFFKFIAFFLDPLFHQIGSFMLELKGLESLYTTLYNMPIIPLTRFNNTIIMGSGVFSFLLIPVLFFISKKLIIKYRIVVVERIKNTALWKFLKTTALFKWYYKYDKLYN